MEEHDAIARLKQGDGGGLEALVRKYYLTAVRAAYLIVQDAALAEDIVQTSFINLQEKIQQFDERREFRPWFLRSIVNASISASRRQKRIIPLGNEGEAIDPYALLEKLAESNPGPEESYISSETRQAVWNALEQLTPQQRAAVVLRYYFDMSEKEISQELRKPKSTIKWALFSARRKLQGLLRSLRGVEYQTEPVPPKEERI